MSNKMYCDNCEEERVDDDTRGGNCYKCGEPLCEMPEKKLNGELGLYESIAHCTLKGESCCGIFMVVENGAVVCNECGKSLTDVIMHIDHMLRKRTDTAEKRKANMDKMTDSAKPLIKYLSENHHPHVKAIVTSIGVEIVEGLMSDQKVFDYLRD